MNIFFYLTTAGRFLIIKHFHICFTMVIMTDNIVQLIQTMAVGSGIQKKSFLLKDDFQYFTLLKQLHFSSKISAFLK